MSFKKIIKGLLILSLVFMALQLTPYNAVEMLYSDKERNQELTVFHNWRKSNMKEYNYIINLPEKETGKPSFKEEVKFYTKDRKYTHEQVKDYGSDVDLFIKLNTLRTDALVALMVLGFIFIIGSRFRKWNGKV